jgi:hypothetical protein
MDVERWSQYERARIMAEIVRASLSIKRYLIARVVALMMLVGSVLSGTLAGGACTGCATGDSANVSGGANICGYKIGGDATITKTDGGATVDPADTPVTPVP